MPAYNERFTLNNDNSFSSSSVFYDFCYGRRSVRSTSVLDWRSEEKWIYFDFAVEDCLHFVSFPALYETEHQRQQ